jgi:5-methylcytosine-specific restriction endonuclease McrA
MPSSPNYHRDIHQEYLTAKARGEKDAGHNGRDAIHHRDRRKALKLGLVKPGQDLDHKVPLSKGGSESPSNWRAESPHVNRSYPRNPDGSMKVNRPKTKE